MFESVLVANRGEIARRIIRTTQRMGLRAVAVYSEADADLPFVHEADEAILLGPAAPAQSYRNPAAVLEAARQSGAQAIHPGYGFLSEDPTFAAAVGAAGLVWVGPTAEAIEQMGDKIRARNLVAAAGVPVSRGTTSPVADAAAAVVAAREIGFPLMVKASAGGGGMGMGVAADEESLPAEYERVRGFAERMFGDPAVLLERFYPSVRHVEVQVLGLADGRVAALGERDCSVQRRNQKLVEETPSPAVDDALRRELCRAAVRAAETVGYRGAGTVEFLLDPATGEFVFLEMNTRLQVEHPITEMVTGPRPRRAAAARRGRRAGRLRPGRRLAGRARHRDAGQRRGPEAVPARAGHHQRLGGADRRGSARRLGLRPRQRRDPATTTRCWPSWSCTAPTATRRSRGPGRPWRASGSRDPSATWRSSPSCSTRRSSAPATTTRASSGGCAPEPTIARHRRRPGPARRCDWMRTRPRTAGAPRGKESGWLRRSGRRWWQMSGRLSSPLGDTVEDGDTLVILESMKMEIPVITETSGTVSALHVAEGDVVQEGDVIAVIG